MEFFNLDLGCEMAFNEKRAERVLDRYYDNINTTDPKKIKKAQKALATWKKMCERAAK